MMDDPAKPGTNGQINLAKPIPESAEKVLGPWLVPAPELGPGMYRYSEKPVMTAAERATIEPPATAERRQLEPWNFPAPPAEITDIKAAKLAALADVRAETERSIGQQRGTGHAR
jgi:hypothetical protein